MGTSGTRLCGNRRPVQPLNGREVKYFAPAGGAPGGPGAGGLGGVPTGAPRTTRRMTTVRRSTTPRRRTTMGMG